MKLVCGLPQLGPNPPISYSFPEEYLKYGHIGLLFVPGLHISPYLCPFLTCSQMALVWDPLASVLRLSRLDLWKCGVLCEPRSTPETYKTYVRECHCFYYLCLLTQKGNWIRTQWTLKGHSSISKLLICDTLLLEGRFPVLLWRLWWNQSSVRFWLAVKPHSLSQEPLTWA